jgi:ribosome-associated protein
MMRHRDVQPIQDALAAIDLQARQEIVRHHRVESWRDRLLDGGDEVLGALLKQRKSADTQALRNLVRNAIREASRDKPPASARKLFKLLREMDAEQALPPLPGTE